MLIAFILGIACNGSSEPQAEAPIPSSPAPSLVLVTLDTTRRDRIGAYGYDQAHTPNIDRLASEGIRFDRAYATVPLTIPAHSSMLTGLYPHRHGVHTNGDALLPDEVVTLTEVLSDAGYQTAASTSAFVTTKVWNFDQGFDAYMDDLVGNKNRWRQERPADEVVADAEAWLSDIDKEKPYFLWVHFYDPHKPYAPPEPWSERLADRPYDGEIAFMDQQIGRLRLAVEKAGLPTAWVVVADHGEALTGEHGEHDHGLFLYQPTMAVPFIVKPTDGPGGQVSQVVSSGVDVMPTALSLLGKPVPPGLDGIDVLDETATRDGVYLEAYSVQSRFGYHPELALVSGDLKLMRTPSPRLFDVATDPTEQTNLHADRPEDVGRMSGVLDEVLARPAAEGVGGAVSADVMDQLAALGYVSGDAVETDEWTDIDAKDRVESIRRIERARAMSTKPKMAKQAEALAREIIAEEPQLGEARMILARVLQNQRRFDEADAVYREAIAREPTSTTLRTNHGHMLGLAGRYDEALAVMESVLAQVPGDEQARLGSLRILLSMARMEEALERAKSWLDEGEESLSIRGQYGVLLVMTGKLDEAQPHLEASLADGVPKLGVYMGLASIARALADIERAQELLAAEVARFPMNREAQWALAGSHMELEQWDQAADEYRAMAQRDPDNPQPRRAWAQAVFNSGDYELAREILAPLDPESSENPDIILLQVNILDKLGNKELAAELFERGKAIREQQKAELAPGVVDPE